MSCPGVWANVAPEIISANIASLMPGFEHEFRQWTAIHRHVYFTRASIVFCAIG
jgi:hypothetical protein